jgi:hypothetical protein
MTDTPIESRADYQIHWAAKDKALADGACFQCATEIGFQAVEKARGTIGLFKVQVCDKCKSRGIAA